MDLLGSTCFFLGSHLARDELAPLLDEAIERHITAYGVSGFVVGHYGNFDRLAAAALRREKRGLIRVELLERTRGQPPA